MPKKRVQKAKIIEESVISESVDSPKKRVRKSNSIEESLISESVDLPKKRGRKAKSEEVETKIRLSEPVDAPKRIVIKAESPIVGTIPTEPSIKRITIKRVKKLIEEPSSETKVNDIKAEITKIKVSADKKSKWNF